MSESIFMHESVDAAAIARHAGFLRGLARELLAEADADDVAQESVLAYLRRGGDVSRGFFAVLVRRLAGRLHRERHRRMRREKIAARAESITSGESAIDDAEIIRRLSAAVCELPAPMREIIVDVYYRGRTPTEIAREMREPAATVRSRLKRAVDRLRADLDRSPGRERWTAALLPFVAPTWPISAAVAGGVIILALAFVFVFRTDDGADRLRSTDSVDAAPKEEFEPRRRTMPIEPVFAAAPGGAESAPIAESAASRRTSDSGRAVVEIVRASTQEPLSGIVARIEDPGDPKGRRIGAEMVSDSDGRLTLEDLLPGRLWLVTNRGPGVRLSIRSGETTHATIEIAADFAMAGRVVDEDSRPIAGAEILLAHARDVDWWNRVALTDAEGRFALAALDIHQTITARADGYFGAAIVTVDRPNTSDAATARETVLVLKKGAAVISGRVIDPNGAPILGAIVRVGREPHLPGRDPEGRPTAFLETHHALTDADGRFKTATLPPGSYPLVVRRVGYGLHRGNVEIKMDRAEDNVVVLSPEATIRGRVTYSSGAPAAGIYVTARGDDRLTGIFAETAGDGSYEVFGLPEGKAFLSIRTADGRFAKKTFDVRPGDRLEWNPTIAEGLAIAGTVIGDDGLPLAGALVRAVLLSDDGVVLFEREVPTGETGAFSIFGLDDRKYDLFLFREGSAMPAATIRAVRAPEKDLRIVVKKDAATAALAGRVLDRRSQPVRHAHVRVVAQIPGLTYATSTDGNGAFRISGLAEGITALVVQADGFAFETVSFGALGAGEERELDVIILPDPSAIVVTFSAEADAERALRNLVIKDSSGQEITPLRRRVGSSVKLAPIRFGRYALSFAEPKDAPIIPPCDLAEGETASITWPR